MNMAEAGSPTTDRRSRRQTPHDFTNLHIAGYEYETAGPSSHTRSLQPIPSLTARRVSQLSNDYKRDSGIVPPSPSYADRGSFTDNAYKTGLANEPSVPAIRVQDDETYQMLNRAKSPSVGRNSEDTLGEAWPGSASQRLERIKSFKGIQADIPSGSLADINLEDSSTNKIAFTNRGSVLYGGKKMQRIRPTRLSQGRSLPIAHAPSQDVVNAKAPSEAARITSPLEVLQDLTYARHDSSTGIERSVSPIAASESGEFGESTTSVERPHDFKRDVSPIAVSHDGANDGGYDAGGPGAEQPNHDKLVAGRRNPSVHMVQAALQRGRVLSAEEMTFSMRIRSMYEQGDGQAGDWTDGQESGRGVQTINEDSSTKNEAASPEPSNDQISTGKTRGLQAGGQSDRSPRSRDVRASYVKAPNELAGGIEDWENVGGSDVDRYGFINETRVSSRMSNTDSFPKPGIQRVATALRVESDQPRRNRRLLHGPSANNRASKSLPARTSQDGMSRVASINSARSERPSSALYSRNPFRSKDQRVLAEASDMLTLPPGLPDISEHQDGSTSTSKLKRQGRARDEKWRNMAQQKRSDGRTAGVGGGMRFEFATNQPKLVERTWKGIPDRWRAVAWHSFLTSSAKKRGIGADDSILIMQFHKLQEESSADDVQIDMDVPRTINMHIMFRRRYRGGQRLLFRVLHAVSIYFPELGYVQGMASLAATLLCYYDEETAFVMLVRLWQLRGLEQFFQSGFEGLMAALNEFEKAWLVDGDVARRLQQLGINSTAYGTRWYLTLFNMSIPFPAQLRVWDVFMLLGDAPPGQGKAFDGADLDVLHATSAALIDATREIILDSDFETAMKVLTSYVPIKDEDVLMRVAKAELNLRKKRGFVKV